MCGRIYQTLPLHRLVSIARSRMASNPGAYTSSFNVCPTTFIPAIRSNKRFVAQEPPIENEKKDTTNNVPVEEIKPEPVFESQKSEEKQLEQSTQQSQYELSFSKWGVKTKDHLLTNCRTQQMFLKPTFTKLMKNRCVVIMQGYYEWTTQKQPYLFKNKSQDHILVAGLFNEEDEIVLLTRDAAPNIKSVHHRMPVVLSSEEVKIWLDEGNDNVIGTIVQQIFLGKDKEVWNNIEMTKLAPHVNSIKEKSAKCIITFEEYQKEQDKNGIKKFFKKKEVPKVQIIGNNGEILTMPDNKIISEEREYNNEDIEEREKRETINQIALNIKNKIDKEFNQN